MIKVLRWTLAATFVFGMPAALAAQQAHAVGGFGSLPQSMPPPVHVAPPMHVAPPPMHVAPPPMHVAPPPMHVAPRNASTARLISTPMNPLRPFHMPAQSPIVINPNFRRRIFQNFVVVWYPAPFYWGSGFWGPWMTGTIASDLQEGAIVQDQTNSTYPSYRIGIGSPGEELLAAYGLEQTECGAANLIVIWGPDNSVVCARPNGQVRAGNYSLDPETLIIKPQSP